jgi:hypothetical protein
MGIDVAGESQLVGCPTQFPSVSMVNWNTGQPNARFWVWKLLHDNFGPGDKLAGIEDSRTSSSPYVCCLPGVTREGKKRVLLVSKRDRQFEVSIPGAKGASADYVDQTTGFNPPASMKLEGDTITLKGFEVAAVTLP